MVKRASNAHPIHELIANRWSPYAFDSRPVSKADARSLFEAARWAASSYNEQPWRYLVATQDEPEEFAKLLSCLVEPNQVWAKAAPLLAVSVASLNFQLNGKPKRNAWRRIQQLPCRTTESDVLSKDLKQRGFSFVGSLVIYAHMQAAGLVNDHLMQCFRHREVAALST